MSTIIPPGIIQRANFVDLDKDDILDVSNTIHTLQENLSTVQLNMIKIQKVLNDQLQAVLLTRQSLEEAKANEESIVESISLGEALLAPSAIRKLPAEILSEIFLHSFNHCFPEIRVQHFTVIQAQNLLLHVCRRWRQTMISDSRFWQIIPVGYFGGDRPIAWETLKERISRAGCTQDLRVLLTMDVSDNTSQSRLIRTVAQLLPRATTFEMQVNYLLGDVDTLPRPMDSETYSNLREVVLGVVGPSYASWIYNILTRASDLKALRCCTLSPKTIPVSCLGRLRRLRLDCRLSFRQFSRLLANSPFLTELRIKDIRGPASPSTNITPSRGRLETLCVESAEFEFLGSLTLPGLRHLSFGRALEFAAGESTPNSAHLLHNTVVQWPSNPGARFFERSKCKLVSLEVTDVRDSPELLDILQEQECLETLCFRSKSPAASVSDTLLVFLETNLSSLTRLHVRVKPDQIPAVQRMLAERNKRDNLVALESCSVVILTGGDAKETMEESHRSILGEFLEGPQGLELIYE